MDAPVFEPFTIDANGVKVPIPIPAPAPNNENAVMAGLRVGGDTFVKNLGGAAAAVGNVVGSQGMQDFGIDLAQRYGQYAKEAQRPDLEAAPWYSPTGGLYTLAQTLPSLGAMLGGAAIGSFAGPAGTIVGAAGAVGGGALTAVPEAVGGFFNTANEQPGGLKEGDALKALGLGGALGLGMSIVPPGVPQALEALAVKGPVERTLKGGLIAGAIGGPMSGLNTALDQSFRDNPGTFEDRAKEIVHSALSGFAIGGLMGAGIGAVTGRKEITGKSPTADIAADLDPILGRAGADTPAASAEQAGGVAASTPPAPAATPRPLERFSTEELELQLNDLNAMEKRTAKDNLARVQMEAELTARNNTPERLQERLDEAKATGNADEIKAAQDAFDRIQPEQQSLGLNVPTDEPPQVRAERLKAEADAAAQKSFIDMAKGGDTKSHWQFSKKLEENPVSTPLDFASRVYEEYDTYAKNPKMQKLADQLGLRGDDGKLLTLEDATQRAKQAFRDDVVDNTKASETRLAQARDTEQLIKAIEARRAETADVPQYVAPERAPVQGEMAEPFLGPPQLGLEVPHPLPLDQFAGVKDMVQTLSGKPNAQVFSKAPTKEAEILRQFNHPRLPDEAKTTLDNLGLIDKEGKRRPFEDAISEFQTKLDDASERGDAVTAGQMRAQVDQLTKLKTLDDFNKAKAAQAETLTKKPNQTIFTELEQIRQQLPEKMKNAFERIEEAHTNIQGSDTARSTKGLKAAQQLRDLLHSRLEGFHKTGEIADIDPIVKTPPGTPSPAAIVRAEEIKARQAKAPAGSKVRVKGEVTDALKADLQKVGLSLDPESASVRFPEQRTRMDDDIEHLVSAGATGRELAEHISENSTNAEMRQLAQELLKRNVDPDVKFADLDHAVFANDAANAPDAHVTGSYSTPEDRIRIYDRSDMETTLMHEMVHSATIPALERRTQSAREMDRLFSKVLEKDSTINPQTGKQWYGLTNVKEFVSEAFTNPRFREILRNTSVDTGSRLSDMWTQFKNTVFKMLGMPERMRTMFDQVIETGNRLMDESAPTRDRVGSVPDANRMYAAMVNEEPRVVEQFAGLTDALGRLVESGKRDIPREAASLHGWAQDKWTQIRTASANAQASKYTIDPGLAIQRARRNTGAQIGQLAHLAKSVEGRITGLDAKKFDVFSRLVEADAEDIDPRRTPVDHPETHGKPEETARVQYFNELYRKAKQMGISDLYEEAVANNATAYSLELSTLLDEIVVQNHKGQIPGYDPHIVKRYQFNDVLHQDVHGTQKYIRGEFDKNLSAVEDYLDGVNNEISSLRADKNTKEANQLRDQHAALSEAFKTLTDKQSEADKVPNFHRGRFGDFFASGHLVVGEDGKLDPVKFAAVEKMLSEAGIPGRFNINSDNSVIHMKFEHRGQAHAAHEVLREAREKGLLDQTEGKEVSYGNLDGTDGGNVGSLLSAAMRRVLDGLEQSPIYKERAGMTPEQVSAMEAARLEMRRRFYQSASDASTSKAIANLLRKREFVQGSDPDVGRNFAFRNSVMFASAARRAQAPEIGGHVATMDTALQGLQRNGKPTEVDNVSRIIRAITQSDHEQPTREPDGLINALRSYSHPYFLSLSPGYVLQQLIQPVQTALPELGQHFGYMESAKKMGGTLRDVQKLMTHVIGEGLEGSFTRENLKKLGFGQDDTDAIMRMQTDGTFDSSGASRELQRAAAGKSAAYGDKLLKAANAIPMWTELSSRLVVGLATDRLFRQFPEKARSGGFKMMEGMTPAELREARFQHNSFVVQETMGRYGSGETPRILTRAGPLKGATPLAGTFMGFYIGMFEKVVREMGKAMGGAMHTPEEAAAARRYVAGHMTVMATLTGTMGLPFFNLVTGLASKALNYATGSDDHDLASSYRNHLNDIFGPTIGNVIARGAPRALGIDMRNLNEADLAPLTQFLIDRRKITDRLDDLAQGLVGAPGGMIANIAQGMTDIKNGHYLEGMIHGAPVGLRNWAKAYDVNKYGYHDSKGVSEPLDSGPADVVAQLLGVKRGDPADYTEAARTVAQLKTARQQRSAVLSQNLLYAYEKGDDADKASALAAARRFDAQHPNNSIVKGLTGQLIQRQKEAAQASATGAPLGLPLMDMQTLKQIRFSTH